MTRKNEKISVTEFGRRLRCGTLHFKQILCYGTEEEKDMQNGEHCIDENGKGPTERFEEFKDEHYNVSSKDIEVWQQAKKCKDVEDMIDLLDPYFNCKIREFINCEDFLLNGKELEHIFNGIDNVASAKTSILRRYKTMFSAKKIICYIRKHLKAEDEITAHKRLLRVCNTLIDSYTSLGRPMHVISGTKQNSNGLNVGFLAKRYKEKGIYSVSDKEIDEIIAMPKQELADVEERTPGIKPIKKRIKEIEEERKKLLKDYERMIKEQKFREKIALADKANNNISFLRIRLKKDGEFAVTMPHSKIQLIPEKVLHSLYTDINIIENIFQIKPEDYDDDTKTTDSTRKFNGESEESNPS